jgi:hypothetical protein
MSQTLKDNFQSRASRLAQGLATTPEDRINWSPAPTARTPIEVVAHVATVISTFHQVMMGAPFPDIKMDNFDAILRRQEAPYKTRESVVSLFEKNREAYAEWLGQLAPESLATEVEFPFGKVPMTAAMDMLNDHIVNHIGQLDYIQTIYGDRVWH